MPPLLFAVRQRRNFDQILPIKTDRRLTRHDCGTERAEPGALDARVGDHSLAELRVPERQTHLLHEPRTRGRHSTEKGVEMRQRGRKVRSEENTSELQSLMSI